MLSTVMDGGDGAEARAIRHALTRLKLEPLETEALDTLATRAARWLLGGARPTLRGTPSLLASRLLVRGAILHEDEEMWGRVAPFLGRSGEDELLRAWAALVHGEPVSEDVLNAVARDARSTERGDLLVEAEALRAWTHVENGALDAALEVARRAYLMGRSEEMPMPAFLASIVLARVRRHVGQPARAAHILRTVRRFAPAPWHAWIDAERAFGEGVPTDPATWVRELGRRCHAPLVRDAGRLREALGEIDVRTPELQLWASGQRDDVPFGFHAFGAPDGTNAYAVGFDDTLRRRVLGAAESRLRDQRVAVVRGASRRADGRTSRVIAVLLLAGAEGCETSELFRLGYGVRYAEALHRGVLDVQLHRCRKLLEGRAVLERTNVGVRLIVRESFAVPDPRCSRRGDERLLQLMGRTQRLDAKEAAMQLGVTRRAAATALKDLAEEGLCAVEERARGHLVYHVEDSLFHSPTQTLERPAWLDEI